LVTVPIVGICGCFHGGGLNVPSILEESILDPRPVSGWPNDTPNVAEAGRFIFAGQPGEAGLRYAASIHVSIVVNLRTERETAEAPFDEEALVTELGMKYVSIPVTPSSFCPKDIERFEKLVKRQRLMLIHDDTSDRAGALWAALLHGWARRDLERSIKSGMDAGLQSQGMIEALRRMSPALQSRKRNRTDWPVIRISQRQSHSWP
jgi:protein tyrosine phosphatase (PTP) superfamily phosphohydrolase (DUF442 family)